MCLPTSQTQTASRLQVTATLSRVYLYEGCDDRFLSTWWMSSSADQSGLCPQQRVAFVPSVFVLRLPTHCRRVLPAQTFNLLLFVIAPDKSRNRSRTKACGIRAFGHRECCLCMVVCCLQTLTDITCGFQKHHKHAQPNALFHASDPLCGDKMPHYKS